MRQFIIKTLSENKVVKRLLAGPAPQWAVFAADMLAVVLAAILVLTFNDDATAGAESLRFSIWAKTAAVALVYAISILYTKSYKSVVRLSTFHDTYRVALTVILASVVTAVLEACLQWTGTPRYIGLWSIFVIGVMAFALMVCLRLGIKYIFQLFEKAHFRVPVVFLGGGANSFSLSATLLAKADGHYKPVLMLSQDPAVSNTYIDGIPVKAFNPDTVISLMNRYESSTLLFGASELDFMRDGGADIFLDNNVKLLMLNQIEQFDPNANGENHVAAHVKDINIEDLLGRDPIVTHNPKLSESLGDKTIMVTGAAGSIGSEIVRQVAKHNPGRIILVDQAETPMHELQLEMEEKFPDIQIHLCIADIVNVVRMDGIFNRFRPQIVYHAAAYKHVPMMERNPLEAVQTNVFGTKNVADLSMRYGADRFVMISTDKAVNPTNIMGASKRIAEIYVQSLAISINRSSRNKTRFITTRFGNVLGSNGSVIPLFRRQIAEGGPVTITHREIIRYFMTIPEACSLVLEAGCLGDGGEIFIFDMGKPVRIYDLARRMITLAGLRPDKDIRIVETGLRPGEKLFEELLNDHEHTIKTTNDKIMIAKVRTYDYSEVCGQLGLLSDMLRTNNVHDIVVRMKCIVPEFKSQNSSFSNLETEISEADRMHEIR